MGRLYYKVRHIIEDGQHGSLTHSENTVDSGRDTVKSNHQFSPYTPLLLLFSNKLGSL